VIGHRLDNQSVIPGRGRNFTPFVTVFIQVLEATHPGPLPGQSGQGLKLTILCPVLRLRIPSYIIILWYLIKHADSFSSVSYISRLESR
jgi:hypothetical protein